MGTDAAPAAVEELAPAVGVGRRHLRWCQAAVIEFGLDSAGTGAEFNHRRLRRCHECTTGLGVIEVTEVVAGDAVLYNEVADPVAKCRRPGEKRLHAACRARDGRDRRESKAFRRKAVEHGVDPLERIATGARREIGERHRRLCGEHGINEPVEPALGADVELSGIREEVAQGATLFILGVAVEERRGNRACGVEIGDRGGDGGFADATFTAARKDDEFGRFDCGHEEGVNFSSGLVGS